MWPAARWPTPAFRMARDCREGDDRRAPGKQPDGRVLARGNPASALALRETRGRGGSLSQRGWESPARRELPRSTGVATTRLPFRSGRRGKPGRRALEHHRRADLQPLRPQGRRLHGGRGLQLLPSGRLHRLRRARVRQPGCRSGRRAWISVSIPSRSSASPRSARWPRRRCGSTTRAPRDSGRAKAAGSSCSCGWPMRSARAAASMPASAAGESPPTAKAASPVRNWRGRFWPCERAYRMAGFGPDSVSYFEGHGTGTPVGDATELRVLAEARSEAGSGSPSRGHRLDQGQHRPHQGGRRRRRADQGGPGPRSGAAASDHRFRDSPP